MTVRILRRRKGAEDAEEIADHIAKDSLEAAVRFLENTESTLLDLAEWPSAGSPFEPAHPNLENLRFRRVKGFPNHVIFYIDSSRKHRGCRWSHSVDTYQAVVCAFGGSN